ncbi:MAG: AAA family ATPase [Chloroflexi bacterium]|nr:AAA family ATPase [Chloroflexota bacterium]
MPLGAGMAGNDSPGRFDKAALAEAVAGEVVGRRQEIEDLVAALAAGRDLLLEGPPGTSKSTLLRAVARASSVPFILVEGNADLTPARLIGYHNPAGVLDHGFHRDDFIPGPLPEAMQRGALLYVEEFNRVPDDTLNTLLSPLAERSLAIPRFGLVRATPEFRLIAAMNPFDNVGTLRVSQSICDRLCRLPIGYQSEAEERAIVRLRTGSQNDWLVQSAVSLARATRTHYEVRMGASVRGAIDLALVAERLEALRGVDLSAADGEAREVVLDAALVALPGRLLLAETAERTPEAIVRELWERLFYPSPQPVEAEQVLQEIEKATAAPGDAAQPEHRHRGPVVMPLQPAADQFAYAKPGKPTEPPRVYRPDEIALLTAERGGRQPRNARDIVRDHPAARSVLTEEGRFDPEAFRDLYQADEQAALSLLGDLWPNAPEEHLRELTRRLALRIVIKLARRNPTTNPGKGKLRSVRYHFNSDDLDLDRTLEELAGKPYPEYEDFWVRERIRARRTYVLVLDVSGSMRGAKLMHAALAAASLARNIRNDDYAVALFWRDAAVLKGATQEKPLPRLLDEILSVHARGLTNLRLGLEVGLRELDRTASLEKIGLIFTDGMHNLGEDPLPIAARYPRLHVIGTSLEDSRVRACQDLAARGRGKCVFINELADIPAAVSYCMAN